jgi:hypothetical protein
MLYDGKLHICFYAQACHLLNVLSKELLGDFEPCAEQLIPVIERAVFYPSFLQYIIQD